MRQIAAEEVYGLDNPEYARPRPAPTGFEGNTLDDAIKDLIIQYHSLNPPAITELSEEPTPLEFLRHVHANRPFVIRGGARKWRAVKNWNQAYFEDTLGIHPVGVASTPHGNADSVVSLDDSGEKLLFVKPHERTEPFQFALWKIQKQEREARKGNRDPNATVQYLQTQDDNMRSGEYESLALDVPRSIDFARIALGKQPDAINFWLGNSLSTTALHKDNYENIYVQVLGKKHFVLLPPVEAPCVNERAVLAATYHTVGFDGSFMDKDFKLQPWTDDPITYTPFPTWDPDQPNVNATKFSHFSQPIRVTLEPGDMLYLPALWYHKVSQTCNDDWLCSSVNYWYDLDFGGSFWSMANFVRGVGLLPNAEQEAERDDKRRKLPGTNTQ